MYKPPIIILNRSVSMRLFHPYIKIDLFQVNVKNAARLTPAEDGKFTQEVFQKV